jgi:Protein of unknown function (DUF3606)
MHNSVNHHSDDLDQVNLREQWEAEYWLRSLACTSEELDNAMQAVGFLAKDIRALLRRKKAIRIMANA